MIELLFWLLVGHSLADYPWQGEYLAAAKRKNSGHATPWWIALTAHSLIHAGVVAAITGSFALGLCELVAHWSIDYAKCNRWFNRAWPGSWEDGAAEQRAFTIDQGLHVACKVMWAVAVVYGNDVAAGVIAVAGGCVVIRGQYQLQLDRYNERKRAQ